MSVKHAKHFYREMEALASEINGDVYEASCEFFHNMDEEQQFKMLAQFWWFEGPLAVKGYCRTWPNSIPDEPYGAYRDVEVTLYRQIYDEVRHGKLYADAIIRKGWVKNEAELYEHPFAQPRPGWQEFGEWLVELGYYDFVTLYGGEQMASEAFSAPHIIRAAIDVIEDPVVRWAFEAQVEEEDFHGAAGKYVIEKYCKTEEQQAEVAWAAQRTWELAPKAFGELAEWLGKPL